MIHMVRRAAGLRNMSAGDVFLPGTLVVNHLGGALWDQVDVNPTAVDDRDETRPRIMTHVLENEPLLVVSTKQTPWRGALRGKHIVYLLVIVGGNLGWFSSRHVV